MVETKQDLGLSVLTSSAVFGAWSAWNSSLFTAATFVDTAEKYRNAKLAMDLGLATAFATGAGVWLVYGDKGKIAAASAVVTGLVLYIAYYCKLQANPILTAARNGTQIQNNKTLNKQLNINTQNLNWKPLSINELNRIKTLIKYSR